MKAIITGSEGFVGKYLKNELESNGYEVFGFDVIDSPLSMNVDLLDCKAIEYSLTEICPDMIFHLAGQADVARSWENPQITFEINTIATLNLLESVRKINSKIKVLIVGSSDQYGTLKEKGADVVESLETHPETPYAVSKAAQEAMAELYCRVYGMNICMTRSFNHGGAGQRTGFMIPDFCNGIARIEKGEQEILKVGNLESRRDFTHVRDVVRAYRLISEKGKSGEIYNVGSGISYSAREILDKLIRLSSVRIAVEQDRTKLRPSDTPVVCCNHSKLTKDTGWIPMENIDVILKETLDFYRNKYEKN